MKLSSLILTVLLVGALFTGLYSYVNFLGQPENYNLVVDDSYLNRFNQSNENSQKLTDTYNELQEKLQSNNAGAIITLIPITLTIIKELVTIPFTGLGNIIGALIEFLNLPSWVTGFLITTLTLFVIFGLVALVLNNRHA